MVSALIAIGVVVGGYGPYTIASKAFYLSGSGARSARHPHIINGVEWIIGILRELGSSASHAGHASDVSMPIAAGASFGGGAVRRMRVGV